MSPVPFSSNIGIRYDLKIAAGTDYPTLTVTLLNPDGVTPIDLTGMTVAASIRKNPLSDVITSFIVTVPTPANGQILLDLPYALVLLLPVSQTALDQSGLCVWDLKTTDASGRVARYMYGDVWVWRLVTT